LLNADPDLGSLIPAAEAEDARRLSAARMLELTGRDWDPSPLRKIASAAWLGLYLLDGLLIRRVTVGGHASSELLGAGDVIRPWDQDGGYAPLPITVELVILKPGTVAVLDDQFAMRVARWPSISAVLMQRFATRARHLTLLQAVTHLPRIHARLLLTLWVLAERWGTVVPRGVQIKLPLTHRTLATLVGCQRPSATIALRKLSQAGLLVRESRNSIVLTRKAIASLREPESLMLMHEGLALS
jgi:CRP-like cAMP-binding protein